MSGWGICQTSAHILGCFARAYKRLTSTYMRSCLEMNPATTRSLLRRSNKKSTHLRTVRVKPTPTVSHRVDVANPTFLQSPIRNRLPLAVRRAA
jgi:hypothetical protein